MRRSLFLAAGFFVVFVPVTALAQGSGWLGVVIGSPSREVAYYFGLDKPRGALVLDITPGSPAEHAGVKPGDVVLGFDGREISAPGDLTKIISQTPVNKQVPVKVWRDGRETAIFVTVGENPEARLLVQEFRRTSIRLRAEAVARLGVGNIKQISPNIAKLVGMGKPRGVTIFRVFEDSPAARNTPTASRLVPVWPHWGCGCWYGCNAEGNYNRGAKGNYIDSSRLPILVFSSPKPRGFG